MNDAELERIGRAAQQAVDHTPRTQKGYHSRDYYRYPNADQWEREEMIEIGRRITEATGERHMTEVGFIYPPDSKSLATVTKWEWMPFVPQQSQTVHLQLSDDPDDRKAFEVRRVTWTDDHPEHPGWHAEIYLY